MQNPPTATIPTDFNSLLNATEKVLIANKQDPTKPTFFKGAINTILLTDLIRDVINELETRNET